MPLVGSGGSLVTGANIVDGSISNADVSASAAIAVSKLASYPAVVVTNGTSYALTTVAGQQVLVIASGIVRATGSDGTITISLKYNGVTKHSVNTDGMSSVNSDAFCLMYTETPGAATANITVTVNGSTLEDVRIAVIKL